MEVSNFKLNDTQLKEEEYKKIFKSKSLKRCQKYYLELNKVKVTVEYKVKSFEVIPNELIKDFENNYVKFSRCFFNENTIKEVKKDKIKLDKFLIDMEATLEQVKNYKEKINTFYWGLKFLSGNLVDNYLKFLNICQFTCEDFIIKYKKIEKL